ncbi:ABC transporter permease [Dyella psychrodurans]|uniref:Transport permease protein n=2 Tax=Dyella psychrodurans TaxID=1927960 RepID=A0A370WXX1_9GAMM|nr:ABC transporter permease [Dyella psychrodurans]
MPSLVKSAWVNRELIYQLSRRDLLARYKGSLIGLAWSFISPMFVLGVYTLFFTEVFHVRWPSMEVGGKGQYATALFAGLIIYTFLADCITQGTRLVTDNASYVTKVVFPLEILPWVSSLTATYHALASLAVLAAFSLIFSGHVASTFLLFPAVLMPLALLSTAMGWLFASLGVYVRDVGQATSLITIALLYTSPVFFPLDHVSPGMRSLMVLNPLTFLIEQARNVLLWNRGPDWFGLAVYVAGCFIVCWLAYVWFQRTRGGFIDVL